MNTVSNYMNIVILLIVAAAVVFMIIQRKKQKDKEKENAALPESNTSKEIKNAAAGKDYQVSSVQDFLDYDKIVKSMIVRGNGSTFTMVIHCSGINFDLLSGAEKTMVEEAFIEFLNFIRFPVQLYVQTRKLDLKDSLKAYDAKIVRIEEDIKRLIEEFDNVRINEPDNLYQQELLAYEINRKQNLYDYAVDLNSNIETMSINSNILQHRYYIAVTYRLEELGLMVPFGEEEIYDMVYTELLTRCRGIASVLAGCDVEAVILDSNALAELLYMAFNRDDAEMCRLKDTMEAGFFRLYSTTEDSVELGSQMFSYEEEEDDSQFLLLTEGMELDETSIEILLEDAEESA